MSRFLREELSSLAPYTPGEQPSERKYIKLNTNESPFQPSERVVKAVADAAQNLHLYPELDGGSLRRKLAETLSVNPSEVIVTNGSDEVIDLCFKAFCSERSPVAFADITYGFYSVFAGFNGVPFELIPLREDFRIDPEDYIGIGKNIFIANPNAPTGLALPLKDIERIVSSNPDNIVVIDEAYVDFGGESALPLVKSYCNLIVTQTFSKSRSLAGARLGFGVACSELIDDLYRLIYSTNPYNLSRLNMAAGLATLEDGELTKLRCAEIVRVREETVRALSNMGFELTDSRANFLFAKHPKIGGRELYCRLREEGVLVRHFDSPRITDYLRITVGSAEDMNVLLQKIGLILGD